MSGPKELREVFIEQCIVVTVLNSRMKCNSFFNDNLLDVGKMLHQDFQLLGDKIGYDPSRIVEVLNKHTQKTNTSKRQKDYRLYYTDSSRALVQERDSFIIDKYGYEF